MPTAPNPASPAAAPPAEATPPAPGPPDELRLRVGGMTCAGCAASVQRAIEAVPGVVEASVSVLDGLATIRGPVLETERLVQAVERSGFAAEPIGARPAPAELRGEIELRRALGERRWRRRAAVGMGLWIPMAILHWTIEAPWVPWAMLGGATVVLLAVGSGFYRSAWSAARKGTTNMDTLIAIGATAAYVFSLVVFFARLEQPLYFGEAAALLGIISVGHWMEARASARAGSAVRELLELQPDEARRLESGGAVRVIPSADVRPGDRIVIHPGDRVAVDGIVMEGESEIDESVVTGESLPVLKQPGAAVVAGALNVDGRLIVQASVDGRSTTIARIAELVQNAQASKAGIQRLADRVCAVFVPAVLAIAAVTLVGWLLVGEPSRGVIATVTVLIISCPCALGLATPMAVMVGTGSASRRGILVKSAVSLERAGAAERVVFDKTGTLTSGDALVVRIAIDPPEDGGAAVTEEQILRDAASVEAISEHPIARAIVRAAGGRGLELRPVVAFRATPGEGVSGVVDGRRIEVRRDEHASCAVTRDGRRLGTITVADSPRPDAAVAIRRLRAMGLDVLLLSGDRRESAEAVGAKLGLSPAEVHAGATPQSKQELVATLGPGTVMVGDGINDAAALAAADLGIAMASGTNIAIESADVVIPGDRVAAVADTIDVARRTLRTIKQNLFFAFFYNATMIPVAALGLLGPAGPVIAAIAMGLSDITVIGNALRLKMRLRRPG